MSEKKIGDISVSISGRDNIVGDIGHKIYAAPQPRQNEMVQHGRVVGRIANPSSIAGGYHFTQLYVEDDFAADQEFVVQNVRMILTTPFEREGGVGFGGRMTWTLHNVEARALGPA